MFSESSVKRSCKQHGRKLSHNDAKAKLKLSRQSARECRGRKKLRYQYLEELMLNREQAIFSLRDELEVFNQWRIQGDNWLATNTLNNTMSEEPSFKTKSMSTAQFQSYPRSRQTSTVSSGSQSFFGANTSGQTQPNTGSYGLLGRSRSFDQGSHYRGPPMSFQASSMSSQLHGSVSQVHDSGLQYPGSFRMSRSEIPQMAGSSMSITASDIEQFSRSQYGDCTRSSQGQHVSSMGGVSSITDFTTSTVTTASQGYINNDKVNYPVTCSISEKPASTVISINKLSSIMSTNETSKKLFPRILSQSGQNPAVRNWSDKLNVLAAGYQCEGNTGSMYSNQEPYDNSLGCMSSMADCTNLTVTPASQKRPSSTPPSCDMAVSYNPQPSTSQTPSYEGQEVSRWYCFREELGPGPARQGAECASGSRMWSEKLCYQYLEQPMLNCEQAIFCLKDELKMKCHPKVDINHEQWLQEVLKDHPEVHLSPANIHEMSLCVGHGWRALCRELGLSDVDLDHIQMDYVGDTREQIYQAFLKWSRCIGQDPKLSYFLKCVWRCREMSTLDWKRLKDNVTKMCASCDRSSHMRKQRRLTKSGWF